MMRSVVSLGILLSAALLTGCVERRFVIESVPSGAQVFKNGQPIGFTPADDEFVYYGYYDFTLVKDGYETLHVHEKVHSPWYEIAPLDFIAENIVPWRIKDVRRLRYEMKPLQVTRAEDVLQRATPMREQGKLIGELPAAPQPLPVPGGQ